MFDTRLRVTVWLLVLVGVVLLGWLAWASLEIALAATHEEGPAAAGTYKVYLPLVLRPNSGEQGSNALASPLSPATAPQILITNAHPSDEQGPPNGPNYGEEKPNGPPPWANLGEGSARAQERRNENGNSNGGQGLGHSKH